MGLLFLKCTVTWVGSLMSLSLDLSSWAGRLIRRHFQSLAGRIRFGYQHSGKQIKEGRSPFIIHKHTVTKSPWLWIRHPSPRHSRRSSSPKVFVLPFLENFQFIARTERGQSLSLTTEQRKDLEKHSFSFQSLMEVDDTANS